MQHQYLFAQSEVTSCGRLSRDRTSVSASRPTLASSKADDRPTMLTVSTASHWSQSIRYQLIRRQKCIKIMPISTDNVLSESQSHQCYHRTVQTSVHIEYSHSNIAEYRWSPLRRSPKSIPSADRTQLTRSTNNNL